MQYVQNPTKCIDPAAICMSPLMYSSSLYSFDGWLARAVGVRGLGSYDTTVWHVRLTGAFHQLSLAVVGNGGHSHGLRHAGDNRISGSKCV